ncbi:hypothetical protein MUN46_001105 [Mesosutterella sp. AGMB02718]|uniref:Uncharacterized protein n=1 Tax=Mesosutterella faecium TaxID=2925194 RepID=A0ABT7IJL0_9BURK|nr:hypothetical protein [Mesosutterella sp. AGMB02718]MDL2058556.1 hypothetical protein [Mesosutterella sp. AGMB02718]
MKLSSILNFLLLLGFIPVWLIGTEWHRKNRPNYLRGVLFTAVYLAVIEALDFLVLGE